MIYMNYLNELRRFIQLYIIIMYCHTWIEIFSIYSLGIAISRQLPLLSDSEIRVWPRHISMLAEARVMLLEKGQVFLAHWTWEAKNLAVHFLEPLLLMNVMMWLSPGFIQIFPPQLPPPILQLHLRPVHQIGPPLHTMQLRLTRLEHLFL